MRLLYLLADKLDFTFNISVPRGFKHLSTLVCFLKPNYFLFVTHPLFQANSYEIDLALGRTFTIGSIHAEMDYLGVVGSYDFHTLSAPPEKTLNYATMVKPYGPLMWTLIGISFLVVLLTFILIETLSANMQGFIKIPTRQSLYTIRTKHSRGYWKKVSTCIWNSSFHYPSVHVSQYNKSNAMKIPSSCLPIQLPITPTAHCSHSPSLLLPIALAAYCFCCLRLLCLWLPLPTEAAAYQCLCLRKWNDRHKIVVPLPLVLGPVSPGNQQSLVLIASWSSLIGCHRSCRPRTNKKGPTILCLSFAMFHLLLRARASKPGDRSKLQGVRT